MKDLRALVLLETRVILRDVAMLVTIVFAALSPVAMVPLLDANQHLFDRPEETREARERACDDDPAAACVDGTLPDGITWPLVVAEADAEVRITVDDGDAPELLVATVGDHPGVMHTARCLHEQVEAIRADRLAALGLAEPDPLVVLTYDEARIEPEPGLPEPPVLGLMLSALVLMFGGGLAVEAIPRRRASGLLEQLACTQTSYTTLVWSWILTLTGITVTVCTLFAASLIATYAWYGESHDPLLLLHVPPFALVVAALSIATSLQAADVQGATLRWFGALFLLMVTTGLSVAWIDSPLWAALVPVGGAAVSASGLLTGGWAWLADGMTLGWTALIVKGCDAVLSSEEAAGAGIDPALLRQARGNYLPEALVLAAFGACAAVTAGSPALAEHLWTSVAIAFAGFMVLPALTTAPILGLPRGSLLPLGRPEPRDLLLTIPLVAGLLALSTPVVLATTTLFPPNPLVEAMMTSLQSIAATPVEALWLGLLPGIAEELLFRGALFGLLLRSGRPRLALVGQALAFAVVHVVSLRLPWTFLVGLLLGWVRLRTGNLWACMLAHGLFNTTSGLLAMYLVVPEQPTWTETLYTAPLLLGLAALPFFSRADDP
jgi:membrane protease YdiL (CAAX protease family)